MTTIPQRLREIARSVHELEYGQPGALADSLRSIAAELEAPAADAVPVVAHLQFVGENAMTPLIRQRDHLATVSALQARIKDLETQLKTRSQKLREAGYTRRPSAKTLPPDE